MFRKLHFATDLLISRVSPPIANGQSARQFPRPLQNLDLFEFDVKTGLRIHPLEIAHSTAVKLAAVAALLAPWPLPLRIYPVDRAVGNTRVDHQGLIEPLAA